MTIHCLQHVGFETPGTILEWARTNGHSITYTRFFETEYILPETGSFDCLLIMGGYMNVDEEDLHPWLEKEKRFIREAILSGKKVFGICLGAQLVARVLGAEVYKGKEKEIGFFPIQFTAEARQHPWFNHYPETDTVFHWHGDTFHLPENAMLVASSTACRNQAFIVNDQVLALQFHPEMDLVSIEQMLLHDGHELEEKGNYIQQRETITTQYLATLTANKRNLFLLLSKFLS